jgi:hypothetical protein
MNLPTGADDYAHPYGLTKDVWCQDQNTIDYSYWKRNVYMQWEGISF